VRAPPRPRAPRAARGSAAGADRGREFLKSVPLLADLDEAELDRVWRTVRRVSFPRGSVIMREGDVGDTMYFFAEGEVELTQKLTLKTGRHAFSQAEKSMTRLRAGAVSFFGDMALFERAPRSATITAAADCTLYEISRDDFERLGDAHPALGYKIMRRIAPVLCQRIRHSNQDVLKLTTALSIALSR
jgi:CRP-like cAMP-binding protein